MKVTLENHSAQVTFARKLPDVRYDMIGELNVDSKAEYSALSSTRSRKLKQTITQCPFNSVREGSPICLMNGLATNMREAQVKLK